MNIKWVLFDWGGVLSQYHLSSTSKISEFYGITERSIKNVIYNNGEMCRDDLMNGYYSCDRFLNYFNDVIYSLLDDECLLKYKPATREMFVEWMKDEMVVIDGIPEIIDDLKYRHNYIDYKLGILSNTWFAHWDFFLTTPLANYFDLKMASHELGALKPNPEIYRLACERMQCLPNEVVFLDDKEENVEGAKKFGINGYLTKNINDTSEILKNLSLLI